ncbi:MAG: hypothetical protein U2P59_09640 [Synergistota bacterium]|nr:hypothetical protein [Synergistota bacterium]
MIMAIMTDMDSGLQSLEARRMLHVIEYIRGSLGDEVPLAYISGFLYVAVREALGEPVEVLSIAKALEIQESKASRLVSALAPTGKSGKKGFGFVNKTEDMYDQRRKYVTITPKGRAFLHGLLEILQGGVNSNA